MRILIVRVGAMGDVLHALPAVCALRQAMPEAQIDWALEPRWRALLLDGAGRSPSIRRIVPIETRLWKHAPLSRTTFRSITSLRSSLRARHYDLVIDLQGSIRSAVIGRLAHGSDFFGSATPREGPARFLYGSRVATAATHVVEQAVEIVSAAIKMPLLPSPVALPVDAPAEAWWATFSRPLGLRPFVLLVPQAGWGAKQWPAARFGELALLFHRAGYQVLINQVSAADAIAAEVLAVSQTRARSVQTDLPRLMALTRRAALVIAGDTGPLHLAAALGRPVVALFGPTDPARTGPYGTRARVLRHASSVTDHGRHAAPEGGLLEITTEAVLAAATEMLAPQPRQGNS